MSCKQYRRFLDGRIDAAEFQAHCESCPACRAAAAEDRHLLDLVRKNRPRIQAPGLWSRIESSLIAEQMSGRTERPRRLRLPGPAWIGPAAAAVAALALILFFVRPFARQHESGLLEDRALARVEKAERSYAEAIASLEDLARPRLAVLDLEMMFLYRDRLAIIDEQIEQCRAELAGNPANAHVRRYLLAALQDKKQTLERLVRTESDSEGDLIPQGGFHE